MKYDYNIGDMTSNKRQLIKDLFKNPQNFNLLQYGKGLEVIFLPSDADELVDRLQLLH